MTYDDIIESINEVASDGRLLTDWGNKWIERNYPEVNKENGSVAENNYIALNMIVEQVHLLNCKRNIHKGFKPVSIKKQHLNPDDPVTPGQSRYIWKIENAIPEAVFTGSTVKEAKDFIDTWKDEFHEIEGYPEDRK